MNLLSEIFNERGLVLALMGALGGAVRSAALKTTWREGLRVVFIGGVTAFGFGILAPFVLKPWLGDLPPDVVGQIGALAASSFIVGLMGVTIIESLIAGRLLGRRADGENE